MDAVLISRDNLLCLIWDGSDLILTVTSLFSGELTHGLKLPMPHEFRCAQFNPPSTYNSISGLNGPDWEHMHPMNHPMPILVPDPAVNTIVMEFRSKRSHAIHEGDLLVISGKGILKQFKDNMDRGQGSGTRSDIPIYEWEDWSTSVATWLPRGLYKVSPRTTFGSKVLVSTRISPESSWELPEIAARQGHLVLLDFNPHVQTSQTDEHMNSLLREVNRWAMPSRDTYSRTRGLKFAAKIWSAEQFFLCRDIYLHGDGVIGRKVGENQDSVSLITFEQRNDYDLFTFSSPEGWTNTSR